MYTFQVTDEVILKWENFFVYLIIQEVPMYLNQKKKKNTYMLKHTRNTYASYTEQHHMWTETHKDHICYAKEVTS